MNRFEKIAWYNLAVLGISMLVFCGMYLYVRETRPFGISVVVSSSAFGLLGFLGIGPGLFGGKGAGYGKTFSFHAPDMDERDQLIQRRAAMHGFVAVWEVICLAIMGGWVYWVFVRGIHSVVVRLDFLPILLFPLVAILVAGSSVSVVLQYRNEFIGDNGAETGRGPGRGMIIAHFSIVVLILSASMTMLFLMHAGWMFSSLFLMVVLAAAHTIVHSLRNHPRGNFSAGDIRVLRITEWGIGVLFAAAFVVSSCAVFRHWHECGMAYASVWFAILVFGVFVFWVGMRDSLPDFSRRRRHEKS